MACRLNIFDGIPSIYVVTVGANKIKAKQRCYSLEMNNLKVTFYGNLASTFCFYQGPRIFFNLWIFRSWRSSLSLDHSFSYLCSIISTATLCTLFLSPSKAYIKTSSCELSTLFEHAPTFNQTPQKNALNFALSKPRWQHVTMRRTDYPAMGSSP